MYPHSKCFAINLYHHWLPTDRIMIRKQHFESCTKKLRHKLWRNFYFIYCCYCCCCCCCLKSHRHHYFNVNSISVIYNTIVKYPSHLLSSVNEIKGQYLHAFKIKKPTLQFMLIIVILMPQSYYHVLAATLCIRCWHPRFEEIGVDFSWVPRCVTMYYVVATL